MAQLVKRNRLPFEWLENIPYKFDREVPQDRNRNDIAAKDADGDFLCVRGEREGGAPEDECWACGEEGAWNRSRGNSGRHIGVDLGGILELAVGARREVAVVVILQYVFRKPSQGVLSR